MKYSAERKRMRKGNSTRLKDEDFCDYTGDVCIKVRQCGSGSNDGDCVGCPEFESYAIGEDF